MYADTKRESKKTGFFLNLLYGSFDVGFDLEVQRKVLTLNLIILVGSFFTAVLGAIAFVQHNVLLGAMDYLVLSFLIWLYLYLRKKQNYELASILGSVAIGFFYLYLMVSGGVGNTAFLWVLTYPLISLFLLGAGQGSIVSLILIITIIVLMIFRVELGIPASYSVDLIIRFLAVYFSLHLIALAMEKTRSIVQQRLERTNANLDKLNKDNEKLIVELKASMDEIKTLQGIVPICAHCKRIRNDGGFWEQVEEYVRDHTQAQFSHSICPQCRAELYPDLADEADKEK